MSYVESGYWESGYAEGDVSISATTRIVFDVKKSSAKTKQQIIDHAKSVVEARQAIVGESSAVYADIYDPRDKTITRVYSDMAAGAGIGRGVVPFCGDIGQITSNTHEIVARVTNVSAEATEAKTAANAAISQLSGVLTPKLKLVNPFEALILDTQLTADNGAYIFEFDTAQIGQGNYHLEIEFVAPEAGE